MIALLNCSINLYGNESDVNANNPSTGEVVEVGDSTLIAYDDLRIVNSKLIELEYEKQINANLRSVISNDSIIIRDYKHINEKISREYKKAIVHRNIAIGGTALFFITTCLLLLK